MGRLCYGHEHRMRNVQVAVVGHACHDECHQDVKYRANAETSQNANRHVTLGVARFLSRSRYRVKTDICKENHRRATHNSRQPKVTDFTGVLWHKWFPIRGVYVSKSENNYQ